MCDFDEYDPLGVAVYVAVVVVDDEEIAFGSVLVGEECENAAFFF